MTIDRSEWIERVLGTKLQPWQRALVDRLYRPRSVTPAELALFPPLATEDQALSGHTPRLMVLDDVGDRSMPIAEDRCDG